MLMRCLKTLDGDVPDIDIGGIVSDNEFDDSNLDVPAMDDSIGAGADTSAGENFAESGDMSTAPESSIDEIPDDLGAIEPLDDNIAGGDSFDIEPLDDIDVEVQQQAAVQEDVSENETVELSENQIRKLKKAILIFNPALRNAIKDTVINDYLPSNETRELVDMILSGKSEDSIHDFLEKKLKTKIEYIDESGTDGRKVLSSRAEYTREGRERQKKLLKVTGVFGGAAIITFIMAILGYFLIYKTIKSKE